MVFVIGAVSGIRPYSPKENLIPNQILMKDYLCTNIDWVNFSKNGICS